MPDNTHFDYRKDGSLRPMPLACFSYLDLPAWQKAIIFKYPDIYLTPNPAIEPHYIDGNRAYCNLRYGFEFEEGWKGLAEEFTSIADQLVKALHRSGIQPTAYVRALVFKEKFGGLRWQGTHNLIEPFRALYKSHINQLAIKSERVCEMTGEPGTPREMNGMWKILSQAEYERLKGRFETA